MTMTREFFVGQDYLGSCPAPKEIVHNEMHDPIGQAFFCPICVTIWAAAIVPGQPTQVRHRPCSAHRPSTQSGTSSLGAIHSGDIPGSLMLSESRAWNDSLPDRVVVRELQVSLAWAMHSPVIEKSVASIAEDIYNCLYQPRSKR